MTVAMLRVKNEARWIREVLEALKPCCGRLYVMDDHSDDDTASIARGCGATVYESPFAGIDEARDKDWLLRQIESECPDGTWVLCIDGDEVLRTEDVETVKALANTNAKAYSFKILYLWDDREHARTDGVYGRFSRPSMFRLQRGASFRRTGAHANLHCSSVPASCIGFVGGCDVTLLHLGYMERADRIRKYEWYNRIDPHNRAEDHYRHIAQGDLPELPASARFAHAGPLKLEALHA